MNNQDITLIEKYLTGTISEEEKQEFEKRLGEDEKLRKLFNEEKTLKEGIEYSALKEAEKQLQSLEASLQILEAPVKRITPLFRNKIFLGIAAGIAALLINTLIILNNRSVDYTGLYEKYYSTYSNQLTKNYRSDPAKDNGKIEKAFSFYDNGNFGKAIEHFEKILREGPNDNVLFYLANAYLANGNHLQAINNYEKYLVADKQFSDPAKWYLILANLKMSNIKITCLHLHKFNYSQEYYKQKTVELKAKVCQ